jgi:hypothetical protein
MINMKIIKTSSINSYEIEEKRKKIRRQILRILAITLMIFGWSIPLLIIINFFPNELILMFAGTICIGIGFILQLLISCGEL